MTAFGPFALTVSPSRNRFTLRPSRVLMNDSIDSPIVFIRVVGNVGILPTSQKSRIGSLRTFFLAAYPKYLRRCPHPWSWQPSEIIGSLRLFLLSNWQPSGSRRWPIWPIFWDGAAFGFFCLKMAPFRCPRFGYFHSYECKATSITTHCAIRFLLTLFSIPFLRV